MKAKKVYESIEDVLKPKNEEEIKEAFRERHKMSWEKYLKYAEELESFGVKILELYSLRINQMTIQVWSVFSGNWQFGKALTKKDAMSLIQVHKQYSFENHDYHMSDDHAYLYPSAVRELVYRLRSGIKHSSEFHSDEYNSMYHKWDNEDYKKWRESPAGKEAWNKELEQYKRRSEGEEKEKIDEGAEDLLKPKSKEEIKKSWPEKWRVTYKQFMDTWEQLDMLNVNIIGTQTVTIGGAHMEFIVHGFYVFKGSNGITRVLTLEDAKNLIDVLKNIDYTNQEYSTRPERIFLDYHEARNYINKRLWKIKKYSEKGESRSI